MKKLRLIISILIFLLFSILPLDASEMKDLEFIDDVELLVDTIDTEKENKRVTNDDLNEQEVNTVEDDLKPSIKNSVSETVDVEEDIKDEVIDYKVTQEEKIVFLKQLMLRKTSKMK